MSFCAGTLTVRFRCQTKLMSSATQLPQLPEVERMSSLVIRITAGNPSNFTLQGQIPLAVLLAGADLS